jgi:hypothetical protein
MSVTASERLGNGHNYLSLADLPRTTSLGLSALETYYAGVRAGGQLLKVRQKPQLAKDEEPGFRQDMMIRMPSRPPPSTPSKLENRDLARASAPRCSLRQTSAARWTWFMGSTNGTN